MLGKMFFRIWYWWNKDRSDLYHPGERKTFTFWKGEKEKWATEDPMVLYGRLADIGPELDADWKLARSISKNADIGYKSVVASAREIFQVKSLSEGGLTELEVFELFGKFVAYFGGVKKNTQATATPTPETSPTTESVSATDPPTKPSSASGSPDNGPSTASPAPSPSVPESPSATSVPV